MGSLLFKIIITLAVISVVLFALQLAFPTAHVGDDVLQFLTDMWSIIQGKAIRR